jgi:hypothetical protein
VDCAECVRLLNVSAVLVLEHETVLDVLALTPRNDRTYADRWYELARVSERLTETQRLEQLHFEDHNHA